MGDMPSPPPFVRPDGLPDGILAELRDAVRGTVHNRDHPSFATHTRLWNGNIVCLARAVVCPVDAHDVSRIVLFCTKNGLSLCVKAGGYAVAGWAVGGDLVIDLRFLTDIAIEPPCPPAASSSDAALARDWTPLRDMPVPRAKENGADVPPSADPAPGEKRPRRDADAERDPNPGSPDSATANDPPKRRRESTPSREQETTGVPGAYDGASRAVAAFLSGAPLPPSPHGAREAPRRHPVSVGGGPWVSPRPAGAQRQLLSDVRRAGAPLLLPAVRDAGAGAGAGSAGADPFGYLDEPAPSSSSAVVTVQAPPASDGAAACADSGASPASGSGTGSGVRSGSDSGFGSGSSSASGPHGSGAGAGANSAARPNTSTSTSTGTVINTGISTGINVHAPTTVPSKSSSNADPFAYLTVAPAPPAPVFRAPPGAASASASALLAGPTGTATGAGHVFSEFFLPPARGAAPGVGGQNANQDHAVRRSTSTRVMLLPADAATATATATATGTDMHTHTHTHTHAYVSFGAGADQRAVDAFCAAHPLRAPPVPSADGLSGVDGAELGSGAGAGTGAGTDTGAERVPYHVPFAAHPVGSAVMLLGGFGFLSRMHGLSVDNLVEAEVVLADGRIVYASREENADLFWALRGGGPAFGIATRYKARAFPVPVVFAGNLIYRFHRATAPSLLRHYRDCIKAAPRELYANVLLTAGPADQDSLVVIQLCYLGPREKGLAYLQALSAWDGEPVLLNEVHEKSFVRQQDSVAQVLRGQRGRKWFIRSTLITSLPDEVINQTVIKFAETPVGCTWFFELSGGAISDFTSADGAIPASQRAASFTVAALHQWDIHVDDPRCKTSAEEWIDQTLGPVSTGAPYTSFLGREEPLARIQRCFGDNWARLRAVKRAYDPAHVFTHNYWPLDADGNEVEIARREPPAP